MSTKPSTREGARSALRLDRRIRDGHFTSYPPAAPQSTPPDEIELSWDDFPDDAWPSDEWVVAADVDTLFWPSGVFGDEEFLRDCLRPRSPRPGGGH